MNENRRIVEGILATNPPRVRGKRDVIALLSAPYCGLDAQDCDRALAVVSWAHVQRRDRTSIVRRLLTIVDDASLAVQTRGSAVEALSNQVQPNNAHFDGTSSQSSPSS
jgi:hypothetical protein